MLETAHCGALDISHQSGVGGGTGLVVTEDHLAQFPDRDLLELAIDAFRFIKRSRQIEGSFVCVSAENGA